MMTLSEIDKKRYEEDLEEQQRREKERLENIRKNIEEYMQRVGIGERFLSAELSKIKKLPKNILKIAEDFINGKYEGLFLTGGVGSGKTYLSCSIARELLLNGKYVIFITVPKLLQRIRESFNREEGITEGKIIKRLSNIEYLILDDLGTEKRSDFSLDRLYLIINNRYENRKSLIITSNLSLQEISEKIHDRIASRIAEMCKIVRFPEVDLRIELKKERSKNEKK